MKLRSNRKTIPPKHKEIQSANSQPSNISRSNTKCNNVVRGDNNECSNYRTRDSNSKSCPNSTNEIVEKQNTMDDSVTLSETRNQTCDKSMLNAKCKSSGSRSSTDDDKSNDTVHKANTMDDSVTL